LSVQVRTVNLNNDMSMMDGNMIDSNSFNNPQSPLEMKPDTSGLLVQSPASTSFMGFPGGGGAGSPKSYPPSHPLARAKHMCSICGDKASGKHYGVFSCEGCKGFFKRTVRKELSYACRENKNCLVDKRQRNRCQFCRYNKCIAMGMKREAVQEERSDKREKKGDKDDDLDTSLGLAPGDMPAERILEAELVCEKYESELSGGDLSADLQSKFKMAAEKQGNSLVEWAKQIPHFTELALDDQVALLKGGWNELLIMGFAHRSINIQDGIQLANGVIVSRENAYTSGLGDIFDRVLIELVSKLQEMQMDKTELGCLRSIVLFNPDVKGLKDIDRVEVLRERVYASLEEYTRSTHISETGRFAKLLLRLPALRSIGLKCMDHLFFYKIIAGESEGLDTYLLDLLNLNE